MQKSLFIEVDKCTGCRLCESVCSLHHTRTCNPARSRVRVIRFEENGLDVPMMCQQCAEPICLEICPANAISKDWSTGAVTTDAARCIGCKLCVMSCPFGGASVDQDGKIIRCDLCSGDPRCAKICQTGALNFVRADQASLQRRRAAVASLARLYAVLVEEKPGKAER